MKLWWLYWRSAIKTSNKSFRNSRFNTLVTKSRRWHECFIFNINMQFKTHIFLRISLFIQSRSTRGRHKQVLTSKQLFLTVIVNPVLSCFVCVSLHCPIKNCIVICMELSLLNHIISYRHKYQTCTPSALFPLNIQHKHYPKPLVSHFIHYSSWRWQYDTMIKKITFRKAICTASYCNTIFW